MTARRPPDRPVVVRGRGLVLRGYAAADEPGLRQAFADPEVRRWNPPPADLDVTAWWQRRTEWSGQHASWAVCDADAGTLLGDVSIHDLHLDQAAAEIGYTVLPAARGRGVATRAVAAATRYAFDQLGLFRLQLYHAVENGASCTVAERNGYRFEGTLRASYRYGDGARHDEHLHARLATDPGRSPSEQ